MLDQHAQEHLPDADGAAEKNFSWKVFLKTLRLPLGLALIVSLAAAAFSLTLPNLYTADVKILPKDPTMDRGLAILTALAPLGGLAGLGAGATDPDAVNVDIIQSRWMTDQLLGSEYAFSYKAHLFGATRQCKQTLLSFLEMPDRERAEKKLKGMITVRRDVKTGLMTIEVESVSPELSMQLANKLAVNLNEFLNRRSQENGRAKAAFSDQMLADARAKLAEVEAERINFVRSNLNASASSDPAVAAKYAAFEREYASASSYVQSLETNKVQSFLQEKNDIPTLTVLDWARIPENKSGPHRSYLVLALFFLTGCATWLIRNWAWMNRNLRLAERLPAGELR